MGRVVLVTGLSRDISARVARSLADGVPGIDKVVGVDVVPPKGDLSGVKYVRADIRTPVIGKVLAVEDVDTVVHLDLGPGRGRASAAKELNVIGSMQLLAACQRAGTVRKLVLGSSTSVYGTSPRDPAMFLESSPARGGVKTGYPKDSVEVEGYARGFSRRRPDVVLTMLRATQTLDHQVYSPLASYVSNPVLPTALGFDPRLQFLHVEDALGVVERAVTEDLPGTFNVAGDGIVLLSQLARRLGRPTVPLPAIGFGTAARRFLRLTGSDISPDLHRLLTYGRVVDTTALREVFGYTPRHDTLDVVDEFVDRSGRGVLTGLGGVR